MLPTGQIDPGMVLQPSGLAALSIVAGLIMGWVAATIVCGVLVTLLDIRDDINDRLPRQIRRRDRKFEALAGDAGASSFAPPLAFCPGGFT